MNVWMQVTWWRTFVHSRDWCFDNFNGTQHQSQDDNFQLQWWPLHRLLKCQSLLPTTFLPRATLTRTIRQSCSQGQTVYPIVKFKTTPAISKILSFFFLNFLSNIFFIWFPYSKAKLKGVCHGWCKCLICNWSEFSPSLNIFVAF